MNKTLKLFLAITMLISSFSPSISILALDDEPNVVETKEETVETEPIVKTGNLEIDIKFVLPLPNVENPNVGIIVSDENGNQVDIKFNGITAMTTTTYTIGNQTGNLSIKKLDKNGLPLNGVDDSTITYYGVTLYDLEAGTYQVTLYGTGYKTVTEKVTMQEYAKRLTISNTTGMFEVGDVNKDGLVNETDINDIIAHFDTVNEAYDLNRDGKVDIADLAYITTTLNGEKGASIIIDTGAMLDDSLIVMTGEAEGSLKDILKDDGTVSIKPEKDEEISEDNAAVLNLEMKKPIAMKQLRLETGIDNIPEEMIIEITDEAGKVHTILKNYDINSDIHTFTDKANPNTIVIDLEGQVAVKKVTIKITKTSSKNLAEIAKVEFLNNVYEEVPTPKMEIPSNVVAVGGSEKITVTYNEMSNVTGYEITLQVKKGNDVLKSKVYQTNYTSIVIDDDIDNYTEYSIRVQAVNGEWKSGSSNEVKVTPKPDRLPPSVDMVTLKAMYKGFDIGYKDMKDTLTYNIYYREKGTTEYTKISNIKGTSYSLRNIKDETEYELYVTGNNDLGEGSRSQIVVGKTLTARPTVVTNYKLINTNLGEGVTSLHIKDVTYKAGSMIASDKFSIVDNNHATYWEKQDWDSGVSYSENAPVVTFDDFYTMNQVILTLPENYNYSYNGSAINYWNEAGEKIRVSANIQYKKDVNGKGYYLIKTSEPITTNKVQVMVSVYGSYRLIWIDELKYYYYDSLEDDVAALFNDDLRVELKEDVTEKTINQLVLRANTKDEVSGESHPNKDVILADLDYASKLLADKAVQDTIVVDQTISNAYNGSLGFAMSINDYQPLGIVARPGEKLVVYVGTTGNVKPQIVFTQYYAEANSWKQNIVTLEKGQNIIDVPTIGSAQDERGGSVYLRYPSNVITSPIKVRVSGGTKVPVLDVHDSDTTTMKSKIKTYIEELSSFNSNLSNLYKSQGLTYNATTSVLNSTDIVTRNGLFSVAGSAFISSLKGTIDEKVEQVYNSLTAFDQMMDFFYRQKGLTADGDSKNHLPNARINIRYMRMFDGAFMYAGGEHIGIGYGSISGLFQGKPNQGTGSNTTTSGYFGWGISHEIGHQINQNRLAYAEITNNVYSLLAQTSDDKSHSRIESSNIYDKIYEKVTSGTNGMASNVFTALGMYWQLHLAYDTNYTFEDTNSIIARINKLSRTSNLTGSKNDLLLMYASEAAGKNLTEFFQKWGLNPSQEAINYASKFEKEDRKIWLLNDEARRYQLNSGMAMESDTKVDATLVTSDIVNKRFTLKLNVTKNEDRILGYEIIRNGVTIGFTTDKTFTDKIGSLNNQALTYQVVAYDYYLNKTEVITLEEVKLSHDGSIKKDNFSIISNVKGTNDNIDYEDPSMDQSKLSVHNLIDNNDSFFNGTVKINKNDNSNAYVIIDLNTKLSLSGIKYQAALEDGKLMTNTISKYNIYVSKDRNNWTLAKKGTFNLNENNDYTNIIYFDKEGTTGGDQLWTYDDISYVKIESVGNTKGISGAEIDLIAPPGDNVEASNDTIGRLSEDYHYLDESGNDAVIKAGSVIFKGDYRGNPAFNVVLLVDANDSSIVYEGDNFLFAKLNSDATVSEIAKGYWFYALTKEEYEKMTNTEVRAELYRVDNALTNDGQRLTSTSLKVSNLPSYDNLKDMQIIDSTKGE